MLTFSQLVRAEGVEPSSHAWEAHIIADILCPREVALDESFPLPRRNPEVHANAFLPLEVGGLLIPPRKSAEFFPFP